MVGSDPDPALPGRAIIMRSLGDFVSWCESHARCTRDRHENRRRCYSARRAFTGLTEAARCAGMMLATKAQMPSARTDPLSTTGSHPLTWYSCAAIRWAHAME